MDPRARLAAYREQAGVASVWLCRPASVAWIADGADTVVDREAETGVAAVGVDGGDLAVLAPNNETERLAAEEFDPGTTVESFPWHTGSLREAVRERAPRPAVADVAIEGLGHVDPAELRIPLHEDAIERYRELGRATATELEAVARTIEPEDAERAVAARLRGRLEGRGIAAPVALVGGANRAPAYRHYTPTATRLGGYALLSVTARRDGLYASCTRTVAFDPPAWLEDRHAAACRVETAALAATREGETAGAVFERLREAYAALEWPEEWRRHHQGGAAGYAGREWIATPDSGRPVELPMAFAYNPTVRGAKSEDTALVAADGVEVLTATGEWPTRTVAVDGLTLDRPAPLRP